MTEESYIGVSDGKATSFVGPDAVRFFQATSLMVALKMYAKIKMIPNRAYTPTNMLRAASTITGKQYKRGDYIKAADDIKIWTNEMSAALPRVEG